MKVLVVAAHPDDEVIGCGGTIGRHAAEGDHIDILIISEGATSRSLEGENEVIKLRESAKEAAKLLDAKPPVISGFPDNRLDSLDLLDVVKEVEKYVEQIRPETVYTHHGGDLNIDHRIVHSAVITACRPVPGSPIRRILSFETASSTEWATPSIGQPFRPSHYVDIGTQLPIKLAALNCYGPENRPFPHARSAEAIEALARLRGAQAGMAAAEAFQVELDLR